MVSSSKPPALLKFLHAIVYYPETAGMVVPILSNVADDTASTAIVPQNKKKQKKATLTSTPTSSAAQGHPSSIKSGSGSGSGGDIDEYGLFIVKTLILCVASRTNHDVSQMVCATAITTL